MSDPQQPPAQTQSVEDDIKEIKGILNNKPAEKPADPILTREDPLTQETYETRIAELDKKEKAIDAKLTQIGAIQDKLTAEGRAQASGGAEPTEDELQKKKLMANFGGCIDGLDKMI